MRSTHNIVAAISLICKSNISQRNLLKHQKIEHFTVFLKSTLFTSVLMSVYYQHAHLPHQDINVHKKAISIPFCTWKDSITPINDIAVYLTMEARHFRNFSQAYEEQQYLPLCPEHSPFMRGRTEVYQGNITWEQAQLHKTVRYSPVYSVKDCPRRVF